MIEFRTKWFGAEAIEKIKNVLADACTNAAGDVYLDAQKNWPVDTGRSKAAMKHLPAKIYKASTSSRVQVSVPYAVFVEYHSKALRRALMANEKKSLGHFREKI